MFCSFFVVVDVLVYFLLVYKLSFFLNGLKFGKKDCVIIYNL